MSAIKGTYRNGQVVLDVPPGWPEGTEVRVEPICDPNGATGDEPLPGTEQLAERLLPQLVGALPGQRLSLERELLARSSPRAIVETAFRKYDETAKADYLHHAAALLYQFGGRAWPTLREIARLPRPECELFVGVIARCPGVPLDQRAEALDDLARHPEPAVRLAVLGHLSELDPDLARPRLAILAEDDDGEIRGEARAILTSMG